MLSRYKKYFTYSAFVVAAGVVSFLSDAGGALENVKKLFGQKDPLVLVTARLSPFARDPRIRNGRDEALLSLEVKNYGKETVMLLPLFWRWCMPKEQRSVRGGHLVGAY